MSREEIIRQIVKRDVEQLDLSEEIVCDQDAALYESACDQFGTWETALKYAGVNVRPKQTQTRYRPTRVIKEIHILRNSGDNLTARHNMRQNRKLFKAASRHFGTWNNALFAAGINPRGLRRPKVKIDGQILLKTLQQRNAAGLSLVWTDVCRENRAFASTVKSFFGSWRNAMIAAGIPAENYRRSSKPRWYKERIVESIRERHLQGNSLKCAVVRREYPTLLRAAQKHFGSWQNAISAAELEDD